MQRWRGQEVWGVLTRGKGSSADQFCDSSKLCVCTSVFSFIKEDNRSNQPEGWF